MSAAPVQNPFILRCDGALTLANAVHWRERLQSALARNGKVLVDVGASDDLDMTFVQLLVAAKKTADITGKSIGVSAMSAKLDGAHVAANDFPSREEVPAAVQAEASDAPAANDIDRAAVDTLISEIGIPAVQQTLDVFFGEMTARLAALEGYVNDTGNAAVGRETHLLKGTAGTFGLTAFSAEVVAFERGAADLSADAYAAALTQMAATMRRSQSALAAMVRAA